MKLNVVWFSEMDEDAQTEMKYHIDRSLQENGVAILPPIDVIDSLYLIKRIGIVPMTIILDLWYNKGVGGIRDDYQDQIIEILRISASITDHIFLGGFPEIVAYFVDKLPDPLNLVAWLTWYYKNNPSVIRGWRSSQNACLHLRVRVQSYIQSIF